MTSLPVSAALIQLRESRVRGLVRRFVARARTRDREQPGLLQRWYAAQPTQRIVISVLELERAATPQELERALRQLCERHPQALGVCEARSQTRLVLRQLSLSDALPLELTRQLDSQTTEQDDSQLWARASAELHRPFPIGGPLFRVVVTPDRRRVLGVFDHIVADGVSVALFARELASLLAGESLAPLRDDPRLPLDARLPLRPSLRALVRSLAPTRRTELLLTPPQPAAAVPVRAIPRRPPALPLRTRILPHCLSRARVELLRSKARTHAVTLHAALGAAALLAALEVLETHAARVRLTTPVSLRERCDPRPSGLGVFIGGIDTDLTLALDRNPWWVARQCMRDIVAKSPGVQAGVGLLALAGDLEKLARRIERDAPHGRTATVEVSNVGELRGLPGGAVVWLTQGCHYHAALFVLTSVTSDSDGALRSTLAVPEPLIDAARAARFLLAFDRRLEELSRDLA